MIPTSMLPRNSGPLVSVLLPTRGRAQYLLKSLDSLISLARNPGDIEFIFKADDDDKETLDTLTNLNTRLPQLAMTVLVTPRGRGYLDMGSWTTLMVQHAKGDWLTVFNDDAVMETQDWDIRLGTVAPSTIWHVCPEDICLLTVETNGQKDSNEFFFVRRKSLELMGRQFLSPYIDSWLFEIFNILQSHIRVNAIKVKHLRDTLRDDTRKGTSDVFSRGLTDLVSAHAITGQVSDILRLLGHIESTTASSRWYGQPCASGWWYWKSTPVNMGIHLYVQGDVAYQFVGGGIVPTKVADLQGMWYARVTDKGISKQW